MVIQRHDSVFVLGLGWTRKSQNPMIRRASMPPTTRLVWSCWSAHMSAQAGANTCFLDCVVSWYSDASLNQCRAI